MAKGIVTMKVKLDSVLEAIESASDAFEYYLNKDTGEVVMLSDPIYTGEDDKELREEIEENRESYYQLPTKFDIHEYSIMENFIEELPDGNKKEMVERAISGRGAFRRFKDAIYSYNLENKWYEYQARAYKNIAIEWCKERNLKYEE